MSEMNVGKLVTKYYCAGCQKVVTRSVKNRSKPYYSECFAAGRKIRLKRVKP